LITLQIGNLMLGSNSMLCDRFDLSSTFGLQAKGFWNGPWKL